MIGLNAIARATADTLYVTARNPAPIPTSAAVIINPTDGTTVTTSSITVNGSCPIITPRVIIAIVDNGSEVGSVACDSSDEFSLQITLAYGLHTLIARSYTITGDTGPDSDPVHLNYPAPPIIQAPQSTIPPNKSSGHNTTNQPSSGATASSPLELRNARPFIVYGPTKNALWIGSVHGGTAPYRIDIYWGDGSKDIIKVPDSNDLSIHHHYGQVKPYDIILKVSDSNNQHLTWHIAAISPYIVPFVPAFTMPTWDWRPYVGIYGIYLLLLATFGYIWMRSHEFTYAKVPIVPRSTAFMPKHSRRRAK